MVRRLREGKGLKQEALAQALGHRTQVGGVARFERNITIATSVLPSTFRMSG